MTPRRRGGLLAVLAIVLLALLGSAAPALAHSYVPRSDPPNGGMVAVGRSELTLWFSEPVSQEGSTLELRATSPTPLEVPVTLDLDPSGRLARLAVEPLDRGSYRLDYTLVSSDDGHATRGAIVFGVGFRPDGVPTGSADLPPVPTVTTRWLDLGGILLGIGLLAISGRVLRSLGAGWDASRSRVRRVGAIGLAVAAVTGAATPLLATHVPGASVADWLAATRDVLLGSPWGLTWLLREAALVVGIVLLAQRWDERESRRRQLAWAVLLAVALLDAWAGHAITVDSDVAVTVLAAAAHLVAAGVWVGGLVLLGIGLWPVMRRGPRRQAHTIGTAWRTFSPVAATSTVVLAASGLYEAGRHVDGPDSLTASAYGLALLGKILLVAVALGLAGYHTLVVNDRLAGVVGRRSGRGAGWLPRRRPFTMTTALEAVVLVAAVGLAAVMTSVPTTKEVVAAANAVPNRLAETIDGTFVTFEAVDDAPGQTRLVVRAASVTRPDPGPFETVAVTLPAVGAGTRSVPLELVEPGHWEAVTAEPAGDAWQLDVVLSRATPPDVVAPFSWTRPADPYAAGRGFQTLLTALAVLLLVALAATLVVLRRRGPDARPPLGSGLATASGDEDLLRDADHRRDGDDSDDDPSDDDDADDPDLARDRRLDEAHR